MAIASLPVMSAEGGLSRYLEEIRRFPMLEPNEEFMLAKRWREHADPDAAQKLITSHLRLVAKIAMGYRGYGLPISEVISEGNVGLMQAVKRFEPDKGFRLATYAMWWIRASIQEYVLRSWSLVKIGTTAAQKRLFFNLRRLRLKGQIAALGDGDLRPDQVKSIATKLWRRRTGRRRHGISRLARRRLAQHAAARAMARANGRTGWSTTARARKNRLARIRGKRQPPFGCCASAMSVLNPRERRIFEARRLAEDPITLEQLSDGVRRLAASASVRSRSVPSRRCRKRSRRRWCGSRRRAPRLSAQ